MFTMLLQLLFYYGFLQTVHNLLRFLIPIAGYVHRPMESTSIYVQGKGTPFAYEF
jgi:hypothetical protein